MVYQELSREHPQSKTQTTGDLPGAYLLTEPLVPAPDRVLAGDRTREQGGLTIFTSSTWNSQECGQSQERNKSFRALNHCLVVLTIKKNCWVWGEWSRKDRKRLLESLKESQDERRPALNWRKAILLATLFPGTAPQCLFEWQSPTLV